MGLDRPLIVQFLNYVGDVLTGDLGTSVSTGKPVADDLAAGLPGDAGDGDARHHHRRAARRADGRVSPPAGRAGSSTRSIRVVGLLGYSVPAFWLGLVGLALFYARLKWVGGPGPHRHLL